MSHFSTLPTKLTDARILKSTLQDLGIQVKHNAEVRGYNQQQIQADIVAVLEGECDLGWSYNSDGWFDLVADLSGVTKKQNLTKLISTVNQKYAINKTLADIKQSGLHNASVKLMVKE